MPYCLLSLKGILGMQKRSKRERDKEKMHLKIIVFDHINLEKLIVMFRVLQMIK
ncbi:2360_t:CDS:2 [Acaulospora colombiana]|uniref:2360_t:CDS:1 n=1 Tax=Acaulospora colombiana TaxID=27376 RepID=A0ACA9KYK9_9GLOM|nr:2360_t:CDS:2 [Acaulospora colombiana]